METKKSIILKERKESNTVMYGFGSQAEYMSSPQRVEFAILRVGKKPASVLYMGEADKITKPKLKKILDHSYELYNNSECSFASALKEIGNPKFVLIVIERPIDVIILEGGKTAKEINPLGEEPPLDGVFGKTPKWEGRSAADAPPAPIKNMKKWKLWCRWRMREEYLRTFDIDFSSLTAMFEKMEKLVGGKIQHVHFGYDANTKRKAEIIERYSDSKYKIAGRIKIL